MAKQKRKLIEKLLFEVYDKGLQMQDCNLTDYYEKIMQALNIPLVVGQSEQLVCDNHHADLEHFMNYSESICKTCKQKV